MSATVMRELGEDVARAAHLLPPDEARQHLTQAGYEPDEADEALEAVGPRRDVEGFSVELVPFSSIQARRTDWLWAGRVPLGMLTLLVGSEGWGKSALTISSAAALTQGKLAGNFEGKPQKVAFLTTEDDPARTMRPRIEAAGGDMENMLSVKLAKHGTDTGASFPRDAERLGRAMAEAGVVLVVVDPLASALDPKVNTWKDTDVRAALTPLLAVAEEHDFSVLGVLHTNKRTNGSARDRAMGSVGFRQVVRSALYFGADPNEPEGKHGSARVGSSRQVQRGEARAIATQGPA